MSDSVWMQPVDVVCIGYACACNTSFYSYPPTDELYNLTWLCPVSGVQSLRFARGGPARALCRRSGSRALRRGGMSSRDEPLVEMLGSFFTAAINLILHGRIEVEQELLLPVFKLINQRL